MTLLDAREGEEYIIQKIATDDEDLEAFLFSLGCYSGEPITVVSHLKGGCAVSIKHGRYNIDTDLAQPTSIYEQMASAVFFTMRLVYANQNEGGKCV